jgi:Tripartite tricarboxylate transporter TctB family
MGMSKEHAAERGEEPRLGIVKSPQNLAAGLLLLTLGTAGLLGTSELPAGTLDSPEAGMLPRAVSLLVLASGAMLCAMSLATRGPELERWSPRGLLFVLGAAVAFALTIRGFNFGGLKIPALGLVVAGPLAIGLAALADAQTRWREIIVFAVGLTGLCIVVFRFVLRLPIPIAPWLLGY